MDSIHSQSKSKQVLEIENLTLRFYSKGNVLEEPKPLLKKVRKLEDAYYLISRPPIKSQ